MAKFRQENNVIFLFNFLGSRDENYRLVNDIV